MGHLAFVDDSHGLEPAMRMLAHSARRRGRLEDRRTHEIKQKEGADPVPSVS